jgi:hypothetical protein
MSRGIYVVGCASCDCTIYVGKADGIFGRLIQHAFQPPYGVVDIVIGEVVLPHRRGERFCSHLNDVRALTRVEIAKALRVDIRLVPAGQSTAAVENKVRTELDPPYGDGRRMWRPVEELLDYLADYRRHRDSASASTH